MIYRATLLGVLGGAALIGVISRFVSHSDQRSSASVPQRSGVGLETLPTPAHHVYGAEPVAADISASWREHTLSQPERAVSLVRELCAGDAVREGELGAALIFELIQANQGEVAASFAASTSDGNRAGLLTMAYYGWARQSPEAATDAALALDDVDRRATALHAAISGWANAAPSQLASCALAFPEGPERSFALVAALRRWRMKDFDAATQWMAENQSALGVVAQRATIWED